jgi:hypothetical protein
VWKLYSGDEGLFRFPGDLEFDFFFAFPALMREVESRACRYVNPFSGDLDLEALAIFDCIGKPPQLLDELVRWIVLFNIALALAHVPCLLILVQEM